MKKLKTFEAFVTENISEIVDVETPVMEESEPVVESSEPVVSEEEDEDK